MRETGAAPFSGSSSLHSDNSVVLPAVVVALTWFAVPPAVGKHGVRSVVAPAILVRISGERDVMPIAPAPGLRAPAGMWIAATLLVARPVPVDLDQFVAVPWVGLCRCGVCRRDDTS